MSENTPEHQDPAEQYQDDTQVETTEQPEPEAVEPVEPDAVVVEPADTGVSNTVLGKEYSVTPEEGYRLKR